MENRTPINPDSDVIWQSKPSKWLLAKPIALTGIGMVMSIIAALSMKNIPLNTSWEYLTQAQSLVYNTPIIGYAIMAATVLLIMHTLIRYLKILFENYSFTSKKLLYATGVLNRDIDDTLLFRIIDIGVEMPFFLRIIGRGHVVVYSNDPSTESSGIKPSFQTPDGRKGVYLTAIKDPMSVKHKLSHYIDAERDKRFTKSTELL